MTEKEALDRPAIAAARESGAKCAEPPETVPSPVDDASVPAGAEREEPPLPTPPAHIAALARSDKPLQTTAVAIAKKGTAAPVGCDARARAALTRPFPPDMPPFTLPSVDHCDEDDCVNIKASWMLAYHHVWKTTQILDYIAALDSEHKRQWAWSRPGARASGDKLSERTSPAYWFGPFHQGRFEGIRRVFHSLLKDFQTHKSGRADLRLQCEPSWDVGNLCNAPAKPAANHVPQGRITFCQRFVDKDCNGLNFLGNRSKCWENKAETTIHEPLHWKAASWKDGTPRRRPLMDTQGHSHGFGCLVDTVTESMYGEDNIRHLVTYKGPSGRCNHLNIAMGNIDNYSMFAATMGHAFYRGTMAQWPAPATPTPQPPEPTCTPGQEGCYCAPLDPSLSSRYGRPDGDFHPEQVCHDNDTESELVCATTKFNASSTVGICRSCESTDEVGGKPAGCTCKHDDECGNGLSCYGEDTFGNGVGRCYSSMKPPSWVCQADCAKLLNNSAAYCDNNHPGGARCVDPTCSEPVNAACHDRGRVCVENTCILECENDARCKELGYPGNFSCQNNACRPR